MQKMSTDEDRAKWIRVEVHDRRVHICCVADVRGAHCCEETGVVELREREREREREI
jgi:hypothetical protein